MEEQIVKFEDIVKGCLKKWKIIVAVAVIITTATTIVSIASEKGNTYDGSVKILVKNNDTIIENNVEVKKDKYLVQNYIELVKTRDFLMDVLKDTNIKLTPELLLPKLQISNIPNSDFIQIKYTSDNRLETLTILQGIVEKFKELPSKYKANTEIIVAEDIGIVEHADIRNNGLLILLGVLGGLGIGTGIVFVMECLNKTFRTKGEVERELKMPIISMVPKFKEKSTRKLKQGSCDIACEAYNNLAVNIRYKNNSNENRVVLVTSSLIGEGSTTTATNLARALSNCDEKVILVEGNLRKPSLHEVYNVDNKVGISDVILGKSELEDGIKQINKNLDVLLAGSSINNPTQIINSNKLDNILKALKKKYSYIIIDSPAIKVVTDALAIANKVDCTVLVVKAEVVKKDVVKESIELVNSVDGNITGIIFNGADAFRNKFYNYKSNV